MNPPAALHGAMSRDRKPFTYTPGGLDLSQIKSQRMAQRLMRNAMNPGVPEVPMHPVLSTPPPPGPAVPVALPNYNCMPVQVFPTLPANPKTLLKSRSREDGPPQRVNPPMFVNSPKFENNDTLYKNTPAYTQPTNNNRPVSMQEYNAAPAANVYNPPRMDYGSNGHTSVNFTAPAPFKFSSVVPPVPTGVSAPVPAPVIAPVPAPVPGPISAPIFDPTPAQPIVLPDISYEAEFVCAPKFYSEPINEQLPKLDTSDEKDTVPLNESVEASETFSFKPTKNVEITSTQDSSIDTVKEDKSIFNQDVVVSPVEDVNIDLTEDATVSLKETGRNSIDHNISLKLTESPMHHLNRNISLNSPEDVKVDIFKDAFEYQPEPVTKKSIQDVHITENGKIDPIQDETIQPAGDAKIDLVDEVTITPIKDLILNSVQDITIKPLSDVTTHPIQALTVNPIEEGTVTLSSLLTKPVEEIADIDNEQKEVKIVKKQVTKESKLEEHNGNQNGDANGETETTIKLPTKKSGAKTETKVEVERKTLPDGSVEEIKTTTTKTTIDGRTEIKTRTETTIFPKEDEEEEEVVEEEEEEAEAVVEEAEDQKEVDEGETVTITQTLSAPKENGSVVKTEERSETTVSKKVVVVQESPKQEQTEEVEEEEVVEVEEEEVEEEAAPVTVVLKKPVTPEPKVEEKPAEEEEEVVEEVEEVEEPEPEEQKEPEVVQEEVTKEEVEVEVEEEKVEEEQTVEVKEEVQASPVEEVQEEPVEEEEYEEAEEEKQEAEVVEEKQEVETKDEEKTEVKLVEEQKTEETVQVEVKEEIVTEKVESQESAKEEEHVITVQVQTTEESSLEGKEQKPEEKPIEFTIPLREPSIPLEKVEDVEIKPIGITPIITKTHTENTEIITNTIDPTGGISKQTEYNKIENIVTVNRTTKILDHSYENLTQQGVPTVKTYFPPPSIDRISSSPMPARPYQPVYPPQPIQTQTQTGERRHSLLLERLSMERQMPSDIYQYSNLPSDQAQYQPEPQSEVLVVSNVKPSAITNQQWYQQTQSTVKQTQNTLYNNVSSTATPVGAPWAQPKSPQPQYQPPPAQPQQYQPPPPPQQPQPTYQAQYQPSYQRGTTPQPQFQRGTTPQPQFQRGTTPQPQFQKAATPQPQYQAPYTEPIRDRTPTNNYSTYTPTPTWVSNTVESTPTQYSHLNKDTTQSYQKNTTQQYSSGYVPPPWEQDSSYTSVSNTSEKFYQEVPRSNTFSPAPSLGWQPAAPPAKPNKAPIAYIPPAPNQSFVKPVTNVEPPRQPGRKTYYSEYERRYITVPESTYIPTETQAKFQHQPDPSPQYYYDNNEPTESVEPQWRKELREFTEKTSQTTTTEQTNVQPPWEADTKYAKTPATTYTPTPTWSQTLRPQSHYERSFESELSQEWSKTNTLGRGRPLSTIGKSVDAVPERARGVSVDRYNPNNYQPPAEHPPVQTHTLITPTPGYHNPNVPAYHSRASAEPRELSSSYQQRVYRESRLSPLQSRSFKYLQWITGTEN